MNNIVYFMYYISGTASVLSSCSICSNILYAVMMKNTVQLKKATIIGLRKIMGQRPKWQSAQMCLRLNIVDRISASGSIHLNNLCLKTVLAV